MSKHFQFFFSHLFISLIIALLAMVLVLCIWSPLPLAKAVGVIPIFLMMIVINVIIAPLLSLIVYKEGKKTLKADLSIIVILQILALGYGVYSIEGGRPVWVAYNVDRFELVRKNEVITDHIEQALPQFQDTPWFKPQYVAVKFATDVNQRNDDMFSEVFGGISIAQKPERYVNINQAKSQLQQRAKSLKELNHYNDVQQVNYILSKHPQANAFVPLKANAVDMTVLINKDKGEVVKIVDLRPWK
jgi:hypothetical protein